MYVCDDKINEMLWTVFEREELNYDEFVFIVEIEESYNESE